MNSLYRIGIILSLLLLAPSSFAATIEELTALIEKEQIAEAYLMAKAMSKDHMGQADFDFLYGLAARQAAHPAEAAFAFERVAMLDPTDIRTAYEYTLALVDINDLQSALKNIEFILASTDVDENIRANTEALLGVLTSAQTIQEGGVSFSSTIRFDVGYNSNVNSGTNGPPIFPIQGPISQDGFANLGATSMVKFRLNNIHALYITLASDNRKNFRSTAWDSNSLNFQTGYEMNFEKVTLRLPISADVNFTDYAFDRYGASVAAEVGLPWDEKNLTTFSAEFSAKLFPTNSAINYFAIPISASHWANLSGVSLSTSLSYTPGISFTNPALNSVAHSEVGLSTSASMEVAAGHSLSPSINLMYLYYPVNFYQNGARNDFNFTGQISYEWQISEVWTITPSFSYNYGWSSDPGQIYSRLQPQVGVRCQL